MNGFLLFLNISGGEILVILIVVYLVFGPKKIPELARMLGKGINEMRRATNDIKNEINREITNVKKEANLDLDIDLKDPLGIKKSVENSLDPIDIDSKPTSNPVKKAEPSKEKQEEKSEPTSEKQEEKPENSKEVPNTLAKKSSRKPTAKKGIPTKEDLDS